MWLIKNLLIKYKWKILRYLVKKRIIKFRKMMVRMYHIQELETLKNMILKNWLIFLIKRQANFFINEFPNEYLHKPDTDI